MRKSNRLLVRSILGLSTLIAISTLPIHSYAEVLKPSIAPDRMAHLEKKLASKLKKSHRFGYPKQAYDYFVEQRLPSGESVLPFEKYGRAQVHKASMPLFSSSTNQLVRESSGIAPQALNAWVNLGPGNVGGRTRTLIISPKKPKVMYTAGVSGGVWKTTNGGKKWKSLDDQMSNMAVTTLAMQQNKPQVIYAGTGEGYFNGDAVRGDGIFKTTDAGKNWVHLSATSGNNHFFFVNKIVISPNKSGRIYAATRTGLWRSKNGGESWKQLYNAAESEGCMDLVIRSDKGPEDHLLLSCGSFSGAAVYLSQDSGVTLNKVLSNNNMGRTTLAIAPSKQSTMYALASSVDNGSDYYLGLHAVYRSTDGGETWKKRTTNTDSTKLNTLLLTNTVFANFVECGYGSQNSFFNQGWYDNIIAVDPVNPKIVWAGGIDLFRSDDGGQNWGIASYWWLNDTHSSYVHADQHAIVFHPKYDGSTNTTAYITNDGGIYRTLDARGNTFSSSTAACAPTSDPDAISWENLNNSYSITQFYHGQSYPSGITYFGGTQDNGTIRGKDSLGVNGWVAIAGGDGGYVAIDPKKTKRLFVENTRLSIQKSVDGGGTFSSAVNGITEASGNFLFINPFLMDPNNSKIMWTGGRTLWRTEDRADNWVQASISNMSTTGSFSAYAVANGNSKVVVAGTQRGSIFSTNKALETDETSQWAESQPASGFVSSLTFDPNNKKIVYATYSTFGIDHIWKSTDRGRTWKAIDNRDQSNGIPDIPVHTLVIDPDATERLYAGTDLGIFVSRDGGDNWAVENTDFTNTVVEHLQINENQDGKALFAFTHGRGAWRTALQ